MTKSLINTEDLHRAVDGLIQGERMQITREDKTTEWKPVPSLWDQLADAVAYSGNGGSAVAKSKPPITTGVVKLMMEISDATTEGVTDLAGTNHRDVPRNLRAVAAALVTLNDLDLTAWWVEHLRQWIGEARGVLRLDPDRPRWARGTSCPQCGERTATTTLDGEATKTPALAIVWAAPDNHLTKHTADTDWLVRSIECRACASVWWRGDDMNALVDQMLNANHTRETMTGDSDTPDTRGNDTDVI